MSNSTRPSKRVVPAIPLNFSKPQSTKPLATPDSSEPSGSDSRQENAALSNDVGSKSAHSVQQAAPLTPPKSSTPANGDGSDEGITYSGSDARHENHGDDKGLHPTLPATPVSTSDSHSPSQDRRSSITKELKIETGAARRDGTPLSNGVPAFSPQTGTYRMPPPFYPSEKSSSPVSQSQRSRVDDHHPDITANIHHPRPSAGGLVFGGMPDSSSTSPVPFTPGASQYPQPALHYSSTFTGNVNAAPFYPAVAIPQSSDSQSGVGYAPLTATAANFPTYSPTTPWLPSGVPFHYPVPAGAAPVQFGMPISPSLSQQSSAKAGHDRQVSRQHSSDGLGWHTDYVHTTSRPATGNSSTRDSAWDRPPTGQTGSSGNDSSLEGYLLSQFCQLDYADCMLEVYLNNDLDAPARFPAHRLLLSRSPRLAAEITAGSAMVEFEAHGLRVVRLWAPNRFATPAAIAEALRYLYGASLPSKESRSQAASSNTSPEDERKCFAGTLSYIAAGSILELPEFSLNTLEASMPLTWDTVEQALSFALDGVDSPAAPVPGHPKRNDSLLNGEFEADYSVPYEHLMLNKALDFLSTNFPDDFLFDSTAPQLSQSPRLPAPLLSGRPSVSDPRLSRIQFGDIHGEAPTEAKRVNSLLSSILVSLPLSTLKVLLERTPKSSEIAQSVIDERERRRLKAVKASRTSKFVGATDESGLWDNLFWEERIEDSKLSRVRKPNDNADTTLNK